MSRYIIRSEISTDAPYYVKQFRSSEGYGDNDLNIDIVSFNE